MILSAIEYQLEARSSMRYATKHRLCIGFVVVGILKCKFRLHALTWQDSVLAEL